MAIAFNTSTHGTDQASTTNTWSHTCTGANLLLIVATFSHGNTDLVSGATYGGVSMTSFGTVLNIGYGRLIHLWYLLSPSQGSNTVSLTVSNADNVQGISVSYTGVKQTGFPDAGNGGTYPAAGAGNPYSPTPNVTTIADNCWSFVAFSSPSNTLSTGSGGTTREVTTSGIIFSDSNQKITPAQNYGINIINSTNDKGQGWDGSFAPAPEQYLGGAFLLSMM